MNAPARTAMQSRRPPASGGQQGIVLFVALIVLVAMSLAAVALIRSVDTGVIVAGNQAFKQGALGATDRGILEAMNKFDTAIVPAPIFSNEANTFTTSAADCYLSTAFTPSQVDPKGLPRLLLDPKAVQTPFVATFDASYPACKFTIASTGEDVRYIIDRQCDSTLSGLAPTNTNCNVVSTSTPARTDSDLHTGSESVPLYRVTVRVDGPRRTVSYAQVVFRP
jgi:Tfp pilus assembly protein PilX